MNANDTYLDEVRRRLDGLTPSQRETVLDDLQGHLADAADAGRSSEETHAALGTPAEIAERSYEEFGGAPAAGERAWRVLLWTAVGVGILLAVVVAFILPSYASDFATADENGNAPTPQTLVDVLGIAGALLCLIPAVIALAPLLVPERFRSAATLVVAIVLTAFSIIAGFTIGGFFTPVAMLAWAAVITPWRLREAGGFGLAWRLAGAALIALPVLVLLAGMLTGTVSTTSAVSVAIIVLAAILAVLVGIGYRAAGWGVAALGALLLVSVILNFGMLAIVVVGAGGLLLAVGLAHALGARR